MSAAAVEKLAWGHINTVLLDLDGTLLDLAFDNDFWLGFIPSAYAAAHALTVEQARAVLAPRFRACEGTLAWYCIEHWSRELGLDVEALKRSQAEKISWLPGAQGFLRRARASGKRLVLLTNTHPQVLRIKDEQTGVTRYVDAAISSHAFGAPKESAYFWEAVRAIEPFDPDRTLFVDTPRRSCGRHPRQAFAGFTECVALTLPAPHASIRMCPLSIRSATSTSGTLRRWGAPAAGRAPSGALSA